MGDTTALLDEQALTQSLEGIPHSDYYYEFVYLTRKGLPKSITLPLFPSVRTLFRGSLYAVARAYTGCEAPTDEQHETIGRAYVDRAIFDYEYVYPGKVDEDEL